MRYIIRTEQPDAGAQYFGLQTPLYVVLDSDTGKRVPFGAYSDWRHAADRAIRENAKKEKLSGQR